MELIRLDAKKEGVVMLQTLEEYCLKIIPKLNDDEVGAFDLDEDYYDYENESGMHFPLPFRQLSLPATAWA
ncbi:unnamed protein product [Toxocara canis]|uniref:Pre-mRNA-splicing factor 38 n=1 Tax=Toxocara canis TaxID=6265 RepID=A0A183VF12_TOXCA|nr:unnamed protein product [Toxocara canis]